MAQLKRKEARDLLFGLLFETEFKAGEDPAEIYDLSCQSREIPDDPYVKSGFFGICKNMELLDAIIGKYAKGWRTDRLSRVSRTVIRLAVYEILFVKDIPFNVSVSEAVEFSKKYGEEKAKAFVNGVLSSIVRDVNEKGVDEILKSAMPDMPSMEDEKDE